MYIYIYIPCLCLLNLQVMLQEAGKIKLLAWKTTLWLAKKSQSSLCKDLFLSVKYVCWLNHLNHLNSQFSRVNPNVSASQIPNPAEGRFLKAICGYSMVKSAMEIAPQIS